MKYVYNKFYKYICILTLSQAGSPFVSTFEDSLVGVSVVVSVIECVERIKKSYLLKFEKDYSSKCVPS
jgi:hypothetical protein